MATGVIVDTGTTLLCAILDAPADDAPRLIYADWLDEHVADEWCATCSGRGTVEEGDYYRTRDRGCPRCGGKGSRSNGFAERAEFIRVQVELAKPADPNDSKYVALRRRERELLKQHEKVWDLALLRSLGIEVKEHQFLGLDGDNDNCPALFDRVGVGGRFVMSWKRTRGFVAAVRCTIAAWRCERCEGRGTTRLRAAGVRPSDPMTCPDCKGTGGIGPRLVREQPIETVVTDREPAVHNQNTIDTRSYPLNKPFWFRDNAIGERHWLPLDLWELLDGHERLANGAKYFPTRAAALAALSAALIRWAKAR